MDEKKENYTTMTLHIEDKVLKEIEKALWRKAITGYITMMDEHAWCAILKRISDGKTETILRKKDKTNG